MHGRRSWSHLTNARLIDCILKSVEDHTDVWISVSDAIVTASLVGDELRINAQARDKFRVMTNYPDQAVVLHPDRWSHLPSGHWEAIEAVFESKWYKKLKFSVICSYIKFACGTLIIRPDAEQLLEMSPSQLKTWAALSEDWAAILLQPLVLFREKLTEKQLTVSDYSNTINQ